MEQAPTSSSTNSSSTNRQRWLFAITSIATFTPNSVVNALLLFLYVDIKGLPAQWGATALVIYAIYNAINNLFIGYLSDRTKTRWGRRIPYLMFGGVPWAAAFALLWAPPFDGAEQPISLLLYFIIGLMIFDAFGSAVETAYTALMPEMFKTYSERTSVAVRMNIMSTIGSIVGLALAPMLSSRLGYFEMGLIVAAMMATAVLIGLRGMVEDPQPAQTHSPIFWESVRSAVFNRSFLTVAVAQLMRSIATGILGTGMVFFVKYSLNTSEEQLSIPLATVFLVSALMLYPWRRFIANHFDARTTMMIAYVTMLITVIPMGLARNIWELTLAAVGFGIALSGLLLIGNVIISDVIDEDEIKTGQRREGIYFGLNTLFNTLSRVVAAVLFGVIATIYGYDSSLTIQPESVGTGFRVYMAFFPFVGALLAIIALWYYPLHGERLTSVRKQLGSDQ